MIAYVRGTLALKTPMRVVVEAAGVGYEVLIPLSTYERLPREGEQVRLLTFHCVREDDEMLFGFASEGEREMFSQLTGVSGVGPKIALAILSGGSAGELAAAIAGGDAKRLSAIKGVGRKTAEKICVELRDKVDAFAVGEAGGRPDPVLRDAVAALRALGFNEETSAKMVADAVGKNPSVESVEQIIKMALAGR